MTLTAKPPIGRPRELAVPRRLNLYVESRAVAGLERLARDLSQESRKPVSLARALSVAVEESPRLRLGRSTGTEAARPKRLSRAIREGSRIHPQASPNVFFEYDPETRKAIRSSALGAAWVVDGSEPARLLTRRLNARFPELSSKQGVCPARAACGDWRTLEVQITHLEDRHGWKREQVARWLESLGL